MAGGADVTTPITEQNRTDQPTETDTIHVECPTDPDWTICGELTKDMGRCSAKEPTTCVVCDDLIEQGVCDRCPDGRLPRRPRRSGLWAFWRRGA